MLRKLILTGLCLTLMTPAAMAAKLLKGGPGQVVDRYIVVLKAGEEPTAVAASHATLPEHVYRNVLRGFSAVLPEPALKKLLDDPRVDYIEPDSRVWAIGVKAAKPGKGKPGSGDTAPAPSSQVTPLGIERVLGTVPANNYPGLTAWVIDTGIDFNHADLNVDTARSANFVTRGRNSANDGNGHGTHVAGTIGAISNDLDVVGVAPGATLVAVRVLDNSGSGFYSWVIAGVDYVAAHAAQGDVANMSLGGGISTALDDAVFAAASTGLKFALAAGNDRINANNSSPARTNHSNIYTVSAIDANDVFAYFSNYGNPPIDFAAPGVNILSTAKGGGTTTMSGTSMAAPHVAGLLLLGAVTSDGSAIGDPDNSPDPIAHN